MTAPRPRRVQWTDEESARLRICWHDKTLTIDQMAPRIGRVLSRSSITQKAQKLGLPLRREIFGGKVSRQLDGSINGSPEWTPEEDYMLLSTWFNADMDLGDIVDALPRDISRSGISRRAKRLGLPNRRTIKTKPKASPGKARKRPPPPPRPPAAKRCKFPLSLVPPRRACGSPTDGGRWCQTHAELMKLEEVR